MWCVGKCENHSSYTYEVNNNHRYFKFYYHHIKYSLKLQRITKNSHFVQGLL